MPQRDGHNNHGIQTERFWQLSIVRCTRWEGVEVGLGARKGRKNYLMLPPRVSTNGESPSKLTAVMPQTIPSAFAVQTLAQFASFWWRPFRSWDDSVHSHVSLFVLKLLFFSRTRLNSRTAITFLLGSLDRKLHLLARNPYLMPRWTWIRSLAPMAVPSSLCRQRYGAQSTRNRTRDRYRWCATRRATTNKLGTTRTAPAAAVGAAVARSSRSSWTTRAHPVTACGTLPATWRRPRPPLNKARWRCTHLFLIRARTPAPSGQLVAGRTAPRRRPRSFERTASRCRDRRPFWGILPRTTRPFRPGALNRKAPVRTAAVRRRQVGGRRTSPGVPVPIYRSRYPVTRAYLLTPGKRCIGRRATRRAWWWGRTGRKPKKSTRLPSMWRSCCSG